MTSGVVCGTIHGKLLAEMACGSLSDRWALEGPSRVPPEPIRRIGVRSHILLEQLVTGRER